ncbi:MAG: hypothetical protein WDO15_03230 [Bacteroidota bacterium]
MLRVVFGALLLVVCCSGNLFGQAASSPFSAFGIGEYNGNATAAQQGMAGVGVSNPQYLYINTLNPALLVFNGGGRDFQGGLTTFQAGILGEKRTISDNSNKDKSMGGNLNYLAIAFPIKKTKWVTAISSMPYTTLNYKFSYSQQVPDQPDTLHFLEKGTGGINQVSWANGVAISRHLSVGAKASYLYSTIENSFTNTSRAWSASKLLPTRRTSTLLLSWLPVFRWFLFASRFVVQWKSKKEKLCVEYRCYV